MDYYRLLDQAVLLDGRRTGPAIFAVEHVATGKRLVVAAQNLSKRLYDQRSYLARREHHNRHLAADLAREGPDAFRPVLLDVCRDIGRLRYLKLWHITDAQKNGVGLYNDLRPPRVIVPSALTDQTTAGSDVKTAPELLEAARRLKHFRFPNV